MSFDYEQSLSMRVVVISDTHRQHQELGSLEGDVLIHCGDFCDGHRQDPLDVARIDDWFARQRFQLILCVGGNHDFAAQRRIQLGQPVFEHAVWLLDEAHLHQGLKFYGSPWVPHLPGWAFYLDAEGLRQKWSLIPADTDVLITHTPPYGILDQPHSRRVHLGCVHLLERVRTIHPQFHLFGHIHGGAGIQSVDGTTFVNASVAGSRSNVMRAATTLEISTNSRGTIGPPVGGS